MDVTYGRGKFWDECTEIRDTRLITHDLAIDGVDFRRLPQADEVIDAIFFDPPYISPGGRKTSTVDEFNEAYGLVDCPSTPVGVNRLISHGMCEAVRVLKPRTRGYTGGRLFVKGKDYVTSGQFHQGHLHVLRTAEMLGLTQLDEFIHFAGTGPQPKTNRDGSLRRQVHARSAHSYLSVFEKGKS
jgi:hypothetical protein